MSEKRIAAPKRGEIWLVGFDPTIGAEIQKTRPALILQNDVGNRYSDITIVAAISSQKPGKVYPTEVLIRKGEAGLVRDSIVLLNQLRSIDKRRLQHRLGTISLKSMNAVEAALRISLGLSKSEPGAERA